MSIEVRFKLRRGEFTLDVALTLPVQGINVIFGPSGSGKTLLLRAMAGLERSDRGYCRFVDEIWQDEAHFLAPHRRAVGYVFQEASLFGHLNVEQNLLYGMRRVAPAQRRVELDEVIDLLGVRPLLSRHTQHLSGGERQRVAMARALLTSPRVLLMDEPLAALDQNSKQEILPYLDRLHRELALPIIYVTHDAEEVARLADHLVLMEGGRIRAAGDAAEILTRIDLPLAHARDAQAIIEARIDEHDEQDKLTWLQFEAGRIAVARANLPVGQTVRLRILARDVSLTLVRQRETSILNILAARILELAEEGPSQYLVRLRLGAHPLLARITRRSVRLLELRSGMEVYVQIKSVALLV